MLAARRSSGAADHHSELVAGVIGGQKYFIAVDGYGGESGDVNLTYNFAPFQLFPVTLTAGTNGVISPASGKLVSPPPSGSSR